VHWNTEVKQYVVLLNRAVDRNWKQDGIYFFSTPDLGDPQSWTRPVKILNETGWYPQVVGSNCAANWLTPTKVLLVKLIRPPAVNDMGLPCGEG
jgi:hypothetical protein